MKYSNCNVSNRVMKYQNVSIKFEDEFKPSFFPVAFSYLEPLLPTLPARSLFCRSFLITYFKLQCPLLSYALPSPYAIDWFVSVSSCMLFLLLLAVVSNQKGWSNCSMSSNFSFETKAFFSLIGDYPLLNWLRRKQSHNSLETVSAEGWMESRCSQNMGYC